MKGRAEKNIGLVTSLAFIGYWCFGCYQAVWNRESPVAPRDLKVLFVITVVIILHLVFSAFAFLGNQLVRARWLYRVWLVYCLIVFVVLILTSRGADESLGEFIRKYSLAIWITFLFLCTALGLRIGVGGLAQIVETEDKGKFEEKLPSSQKPVGSAKNTLQRTLEKRTANDISGLDKCEKCRKAIPKSETPWVFKNHIVCAECWKRLKAASSNSTS